MFVTKLVDQNVTKREVKQLPNDIKFTMYYENWKLPRQVTIKGFFKLGFVKEKAFTCEIAGILRNYLPVLLKL